MKEIVFFLLYIFGIHKIFLYLSRGKLTILLYHGVDKNRRKFLSPSNFEKQIRYIKKNYNILSLKDAIKGLKNNNLPHRSLVITFDDGYKNIHDFAFPILRTHGVPATVFLATDFVDKKSPLWTDRVEYSMNNIKETNELKEGLKALPEDKKMEKIEKIERKSGRFLGNFSGNKDIYAPLSWEETNEMRKEKINFGAHGESHAVLTKISPGKAKEEIKNSKELIREKVGDISNVFAYPNGQKNDFDDNIKKIIKEENFEAALTTVTGLNDNNSDLFELKRFTMDDTNSFPKFVATISGLRIFLGSFRGNKHVP